MSGRRVPLEAMPHFRLFDRVRAAWGYSDMPVIVADKIAEQIDELPDIPDWTAPGSAYGIVAPPFKRCFIEATTHSWWATQLLPDGAWVNVPESTTQRGVALYDASEGDIAQALVYDDIDHPTPDGTRWTLALFGYIWESVTRVLACFPGPLFVHLDAAGRVLDDTTRMYISAYHDRGPRNLALVLAPPDIRPQLRYDIPPMPAGALANFVPFVLKAIGAMHKRCEVEQVTPSRSAARMAEKHDKIVLNSYYVLKVKPTPIRSIADFRRIGTPTATEHREHRVRGHFRYYHPDRPLFGRYSGSVWVPAHDRGKTTYGTIRKDYEVDKERG